MSEVSKVFSKDAVETIGNIMGTAGADKARTGASATTGTDGGVGNTFLTEPLWGQFVELLTEQSFVRQVARSIPMDQPTLRIPAISSGLQVYTATEGAEAKSTSMKADDFLLEAKKIMAQVIASAELYEDSVQNIEKIITDDFVRAIAQAEEQAFLLGRSTQVGAIAKGGTKGGATTDSANGSIQGLTNFINPKGTAGATADSQYGNADSTFTFSDWGTVSDVQSGLGGQSIVNSPLGICDGVLTTALQEGNIIDMKGSSFYGGNAYKAVREAIYKLGLLGRNRGDLVLILNPVSANQLLQSDELMTLDKYGSNATILTGEVGSLFGVKILESSFLPSNGIVTTGAGSGGGNDDDSAKDGTYGKGAYGVLIHKPSLILGDLRKVQVENERVIQNDSFRTVISERIAFGMERRAGAVAIGNIDPSIESLTSSSVFYPAGVTPTLSVDDTNVEIVDDEGEAVINFTLGATTDQLVYLGNEGLPAGTIIKVDTDGNANFGNATAIANIGLVQAVNPDTVTAPVQIKGAGGTANGTGKIMWQSVDNTGNRSDIITITVSINGQA